MPLPLFTLYVIRTSILSISSHLSGPTTGGLATPSGGKTDATRYDIQVCEPNTARIRKEGDVPSIRIFGSRVCSLDQGAASNMATATMDVPISKKPKSRAPAGLREKLLTTPLPLYSGPYTVGYMEIEVPVRKPRVISDIQREHKPLLELKTVLFSIYYPSGFGSGEGRSPHGEKEWSRATWLPRPRVQLGEAYAKFAGLPRWPTMAFFGGTTMFTKLPAFRNAKLAEHWPPDQNSKEGGYKVKNEAGRRPPGQPEKPTFPLIVFSHGLGGMRLSVIVL